MLGHVRNIAVGLVTAVVLVCIAVLMPGTVPPVVRDGLGIGPSPLGQAPRVTGDGTYRFLQHQPGDKNSPVTYNPCEAIQVEINPDGVDDEDQARDIVLSAMKQSPRPPACGSSTPAPPTTVPQWRSRTEPVLGRTEPVLISFATSDEVSELEGQVAGVGGSASVQRHGIRTYVTGQVTLDVHTFDELVDQRGGLEVARAIAMHELGHLVGLAHVDDERELMDAQNHGQLDFGPGDRRGLARLGKVPAPEAHAGRASTVTRLSPVCGPTGACSRAHLR